MGVAAASAAAVALPLSTQAREPLRAEFITVAVMQSRARTLGDMAAELDAVVVSGARKDLICVPVPVDPANSTLAALAGQAARYGVTLAVRAGGADLLLTPAGEIKTGQPVYRTDIGNIAFADPWTNAVPHPDVEIVVQLSEGPISFERARQFAAAHDRFVIAATPVGDSFVQASGSAVFGPGGQVLAAAGQAWTQTVAAALPLGHYRAGFALT
ncbi:MAG: hypothetical protein JNK21_16460 [Rhodospirillaceae bacterium]|nr:hypothetical protein [Rhodospirillaceae bacterium]